MTEYGHRLDMIRAYIDAYLDGNTTHQVTQALTTIRDLAEGVDVVDAGAKRTS